MLNVLKTLYPDDTQSEIAAQKLIQHLEKNIKIYGNIFPDADSDTISNHVAYIKENIKTANLDVVTAKAIENMEKNFRWQDESGDIKTLWLRRGFLSFLIYGVEGIDNDVSNYGKSWITNGSEMILS